MALPGAHGLRPVRVPGPDRLSHPRVQGPDRLSHPERELLFVYGTLRAGRAPRALAWLEALPREAASAPGRLLDLGAYPGWIREAQGRVRGELVAVPAARLAALDAYEGFDPGHPERGPFVRERCTVRDASGRERRCWIYRFTGDRAGLPEVPDGEWRGDERGRTASAGSAARAARPREVRPPRSRA